MSQLFPSELLDASEEARIEYFANSRIEHPQLKRATKQLWRAMNSRVKDSIIFVYGPAGAGKSTLCEHVITKIMEENFSNRGQKQHKEVPIAFVDAAAPDSYQFNWKDFYQHSIYTIESSITKKSPPKFIRYNPRLAPALYFNENLKPCEYRNHFISVLRKYLPLSFFIDEAQNLAKVRGADKLLNHMDILKTISKFSGTKMILVGSYDLVPFRNLSGQLSRRSWDIHFSRYTTAPEDLSDFKSAVLSLQKRLPLSVEPNLIRHWKYIYTKSVGCVGITKDWFLKALEVAIGDKQETISFEILKECALSDHQSINIALEISNGEQSVNDTKDTFKKLKEAVGFESGKKNAELSAESNLVTLPSHQKKNRKSAVGRRKARRDATGR